MIDVRGQNRGRVLEGLADADRLLDGRRGVVEPPQIRESPRQFCARIHRGVEGAPEALALHSAVSQARRPRELGGGLSVVPRRVADQPEVQGGVDQEFRVPGRLRHRDVPDTRLQRGTIFAGEPEGIRSKPPSRTRETWGFKKRLR